MADPSVHEQQLKDLADTQAEIAEIEQSIALLNIEIARRLENDGDVEEVMTQRTGLKAALRTLRLLKEARRVATYSGQSAAGAFLGENIGKN